MWPPFPASRARTETGTVADSSEQPRYISISASYRPTSADVPPVASPLTRPTRHDDTVRANYIWYGLQSSVFARPPQGFRHPARFAHHESVALPRSRDPAFERHLFSWPKRVMTESSCQAKDDSTYGLINRSAFCSVTSVCRSSEKGKLPWVLK